MPQLAGDGWGAPGRATQQLGQSIASLGDALGSVAAEANAEQDKLEQHSAKLTMLEADNEIGRRNAEARATYTGDGKDFYGNQDEVYNSVWSNAMEKIPEKYRPQAEIFRAQRYGPYTEGNIGFGGQKYREFEFGRTEEAIGAEFGALANVPPEQFEESFELTLRKADAIVNSPALTPSEKSRLAEHAAELAKATLEGSAKGGDANALKLLPRVQQFIEATGGAPDSAQSGMGEAQKGAEGVQGLPGSPSGQAGEKPQSFKIEAPPIARRASIGRERPANSIKGFVIHETQGSDTPEGNMSWSNKKNTGANYYIDKQGKVYGWAPDTVAMNHAGVGRGGKGDVRPDLGNGNTLSLEIMTRPGEKPNEVQIKAAHALILAKSQEYGFKPEDIEAHGRLAPGHKEVTEGTAVVDYIRKNWNGTAVAGLSQEAPSDAKVPSGGIKPTLTAYSPQKGGDKMEGGYAAARPGPDGKAEVRTLADFHAGRSQYVTLAGDKSEFGKTYIIPEITYKDASGKTVTLQNVKGVVHDTGSAFKGKGNQRFDIPVDKDIPSKSLGSQPFSKQQLAFIPEGEFKAEQPTPVASRGLTQYAGMSKVGAGDVDPPEGARATNTIPGPSNDNAQPEKLVQVADASGRTVPQVAGSQQRLPAQNRTSVGSHLRDKLIKSLPAYRRQYEGLVGNMVGAVEKAAAEGYTLPDELMAETAKAVGQVGTPEMTLRLAKAIEGAKFTKTIQALPPNEVARVAGDMRAKMLQDGATPEMLARVEATEKLHTTINAELEKNAITWGVRVGIIPEVEPITLENLSKEVLEQRAVAANAVAQHYKRDPQFFTSDERTMMEGVFKQGGDKMLGMMGMVYESFGDQTPAVVAEIAPKNPEVVRAAELIATGGDHRAAKDIAATMARRADPNYKPDVKLEDGASMETTMREITHGYYKRQGRTARDETMRAAEAIYAARVDNPGEFQADVFKESVEAAMGVRVSPDGKKFGGVINTKDGGYLWGEANDPILLPSNVRQEGFRALIDGITAQDLQEAGVSPQFFLDGKPVSITRVMNGRLVTVGRGKYAISLGDPESSDPNAQKWVATTATIPDGVAMNNPPLQLFELDMEKLTPVLRKKAPAMFFSDN